MANIRNTDNNSVQQVPYSELTKLNAQAREERNAKNKHESDGRYEDANGSLWLDVKHKDFKTIALAILTGMYETNRIAQDPTDVSQEEFNELVKENSEIINDIWNFLSQYMKKGTVTVYRGITLEKKILDLLANNKQLIYNPNLLLPYIDNTSKEYNSFSVDKNVSIGFTKVTPEDDEYWENNEEMPYIIMQAEVDNNDINWAFTAYLMGRHGGSVESELNINNIKTLKNVKVVDYHFPAILLMTSKLKNVFKHNGYENISDAVGYTDDLQEIDLIDIDDLIKCNVVKIEIKNKTGAKLLRHNHGSFTNIASIKNSEVCYDKYINYTTMSNKENIVDSNGKVLLKKSVDRADVIDADKCLIQTNTEQYILNLETKQIQYLPDEIKYIYSIYKCNVNDTTYSLAHCAFKGLNSNLLNLQTEKYVFNSSMITRVEPINVDDTKNITGCFIQLASDNKWRIYSLTESKILFNDLKIDFVNEYKNSTEYMTAISNHDESDIHKRRKYVLEKKIDKNNWVVNYLLDDLTLEYDEFKTRQSMI